MNLAKRRNYSNAIHLKLDNTLLVLVMLGVIAGFVGGFLFAKDRYVNKINEISRMNMEKAVTIDTLKSQIQVLGESTKAE